MSDRLALTLGFIALLVITYVLGRLHEMFLTEQAALIQPPVTPPAEPEMPPETPRELLGMLIGGPYDGMTIDLEIGVATHAIHMPGPADTLEAYDYDPARSAKFGGPTFIHERTTLPWIHPKQTH